VGRIIGIDFGQKRVGIAISDESETISSVVKSQKVSSVKDAVAKIAAFVDEKQAREVVVGLPLNMDGSKGPAAENVTRFCDKLSKQVSVPINTYDERLSTKQGESLMISADLSRKKRRENIDKLAAQIILQSYLDTKKGS